MPSENLNERERDVLSFEREWPFHEGHKQEEIRRRFGFAPSYYYQLLARLIERPEAEDFDPLLVRRLRRQRARRAQAVGLNEQVTRAGRRPASK